MALHSGNLEREESWECLIQCLMGIYKQTMFFYLFAWLSLPLLNYAVVSHFALMEGMVLYSSPKKGRNYISKNIKACFIIY